MASDADVSPTLKVLVALCEKLFLEINKPPYWVGFAGSHSPHNKRDFIYDTGKAVDYSQMDHC